MNDSNQTPSGTSRPSLMGTAPAAPTTPDFPGGPTPTRVLADLGGSTSPQRSKAAVATLASAVIAVAAGGIYWASTHNSNGTLAVNQTSPATLAASALPARAPSDALLTQSAPSAPAPTAAPEPVTAAARIVTDESPASKMAAPPAEAPAVAVAAVAPPGVATAAPATSPAAKPKATRAADATAAKATRTAAADNAKREKTRTAAARKASGKPTTIAAKKARSGNQAVANNSSAKKPVVAKGPDPDTDLLAALLRRSDGQTQASLAQKDRAR